MKKGLLLLLLAASVGAQAQTLKETLYGGKLKNNPGAVIRKGDDLSTKIDTTSKTVATPAEPTPEVAVKPASAADSVAAEKAIVTDVTSAPDSAASVSPAPTAAPKNNNSIWKTYMDSVVNGVKTEALSSKKIKKGSYFVLVSYVIETDGQTSVSDVSVTPENSALQQQLKTRLDVDTPRLEPVRNSVGTPRKVTKKYSFTLTKD